MSKFNEIISGEQPVLVDFYAEWCGPCKIMSPILQEVKREMGNAIKVIKVDVDKNPQAASVYQVRGVPTLILFKKNKALWRQSGVVSKNQLMNILKQYT